ncbi:BTAD domain-containing putative transcriptional regulator [Nocardioides sp. GY 10113]|uniref:BTAD domain-containing putative transcriptional regulator n=1 Tax=Nocardioides sp. GY 10113 TaxID=2569761 RepID=UPI001458BA35|nr:BTAD domain-containing putative transcriptional regulator [Nocardioides sp. GY 10113]
MWVGVLGPTLVTEAGRAIEIPVAKHRALLAALALAGERGSTSDTLVEALWGLDAPPTAGATLQTYVSQVRRVLEPALAARGRSAYLVSTDGGYRLHAEVDATSFADAIRSVHAAMDGLTRAAVPVSTDPTADAALLTRLDGTLAAWRGEPYADLPDSDLVTPERARLAELRSLAREDHATLLVGLGRDAEAIADLERLAADAPLRERPAALLAVALARCGRQADALAALDRLRADLDADLGLEPSAAVNDLQTAVLRHALPSAPPAAGTPTGATAPAASEGPVPASPPAARIVLPDWGLVGREAQLAALDAVLSEADRGVPQFVTVRGEPGAGKTRLGTEFALRARERGALVLVGRCSQEEDAPPLWPWLQALGEAVAGLGLPSAAGGDHDAARFALAESIRTTLAGLATDRTVVLGLEDLHWADPSTLRVLRHLAAHLDTGRLMVVGTWRRGARQRVRPLAEAAEALARRHAVDLELTGLSPEESSRLLADVAGVTDPEVAAALHRRTDGNPFFLIEYGRLARDEGSDLPTLMARVPATVAAVVDRRIAQLPATSTGALTAAAVIGREFDLDLLADALGTDEDTTLAELEPALAVDLLQDLGDDRFRFAHALVRDAAYDGLGRSRRERMHATLAGLVEQAPDADRRVAEVARHWAAAGRRYRRRAHLAAARAGTQALAAHAADEARDHLATALALHAEDPAGTERERFELLVDYAEACRWSTRRLEMHEAIDEAVVLAGRFGEPAQVVRAARIATTDALWPARAYGQRNDAVIATIQEALDALPASELEATTEELAVRARLLLALASESYYAVSADEVESITAAAVATARRVGDDVLLSEALLGATVAADRRSAATSRRAWCEEGLALAERTGDVRMRTNLRMLLTAARCELGDLPDATEELVDVVRAARAERLYLVEMVGLTLQHSWAAMRGDEEEIASTFADLTACFERVSTAHKVDIVGGAALFVPLWCPGVEAPPPESVLRFLDEAAIPVGPAGAILALRTGQPEVARALFDRYGVELDTDNWFSPFLWSLGAELGLGLGERDVAARAYARLAPYAGTCVLSGTSPAHGPVDAYLALAAAAVGETDLATEHADAGLALTRAWRIPQVERWLLDLRERHGF